MNNREENRRVFEDTQKCYTKDRVLRSSISDSIRKQKFYPGTERLAIKPLKGKQGVVFVSAKRTLEAAAYYTGKKTAVLNFASARNPGGGVETGANAQEESLCRISTLFPCLNAREAIDRFYLPHRSLKSPFNNNDIIYTPDVFVFKTDGDTPVLLETPYRVDVITCAAPNLRQAEIEDEELYRIHYERGERIIQSALLHNVDVLILGAFGCGVFKNNPVIVAKAYKDLLNIYGKCFETVEFAIHCTEKNNENYFAFQKMFGTKEKYPER